MPLPVSSSDSPGVRASVREHAREGSAMDWLLLALVHRSLGHSAEARTWLTVPGAPSIWSECIVWIESITSSAGGAPSPLPGRVI